MTIAPFTNVIAEPTAAGDAGRLSVLSLIAAVSTFSAAMSAAIDAPDGTPMRV